MSISLIQLTSMLFIPCDNWKSFFMQNYHYPEVWCKLQKVCEDYIEFSTEQAEKTKSSEIQKLSFRKELAENADLYKSVLNKIMTTHE